MIFFAVFDIFLHFDIHKKTKLFLFINISAFGQEMNKSRPMSRSCFFLVRFSRLPFWTVTFLNGYLRPKNRWIFANEKFLFNKIFV